MATKTGEAKEMTETQKNERKPVWEKVEEKDIESARKDRLEQIGAAKARIQGFIEKHNSFREGQGSPSMKAHFATLWTIEANYVEMLETFYDLWDALLHFNNDLAVVLQSLDRQIQEISEKTHVDLSKIKNDLALVREKVDAPIYKYLREQKEADEKIRKSGEETLDHLTRSH